MLRLLGVLLLGLAGLVGLGMSLCGGVFTVAGLAGLGGKGGGGELPTSGFLIIAVPSLLIGIALLVLVGRKFAKWERNESDETPRDQP